jgi:hypothetical protein
MHGATCFSSSSFYGRRRRLIRPCLIWAMARVRVDYRWVLLMRECQQGSRWGTPVTYRYRNRYWIDALLSHSSFERKYRNLPLHPEPRLLPHPLSVLRRSFQKP